MEMKAQEPEWFLPGTLRICSLSKSRGNLPGLRSWQGELLDVSEGSEVCLHWNTQIKRSSEAAGMDRLIGNPSDRSLGADVFKVCL